MGLGVGLGGAADGFLRGLDVGSRISERKSRRERQDKLDEERRANRAEDISYRNKVFDQNQQRFDLNKELTTLKITAAKDEALLNRGKIVSKMVRSAMSDNLGNPLTQEAFQALPQEEQARRIGIIDQGSTWLTNEGGFMKKYLGSNPSVNSEKPVYGHQLMQSPTGSLGVMTHLNRKDGGTGPLDYPNRKDGQGTVIPIETFNGMLWNATGVFLGDKLTERQKLNLQNKNAVGLENLKHRNRLSEKEANPTDTRTPMRKNIEYLVSSGIAKTKGEALKIVQRAKSNPTKMITDMVTATEENQTVFNIKPGDERYRSREQIIADSMSLLDQINGRATPEQSQGQGTVVQSQQPPQQEGLPQQAAAQLKEGATTTFGNGQTWTLQNGQPVRVK